MYGTQAARKIESFNLKMRLEKMLVYSMAVLLLPLAGEKPIKRMDTILYHSQSDLP